GDTAYPVGEAAILMDDEHGRHGLGGLRENDERVDRAASMCLDIHPFMMTRRGVEALVNVGGLAESFDMNEGDEQGNGETYVCLHLIRGHIHSLSEDRKPAACEAILSAWSQPVNREVPVPRPPALTVRRICAFNPP